MDADWKDNVQSEDEQENEEFTEEYEEVEPETEDAGADSEVFEEEEDDEQPDESGYIMELLDYLTEALSKPTASSFMQKPHVDVEKCLDIVDNIRQNIPVGIQYGNEANKQRERILHNAEKIAESKTGTAQLEAQGIRSDAQREADNIVEEATAQANATIEGAKQKAAEIEEKARRKAHKLTNEEAVLREARKEAAELKRKSSEAARETRRKALSDAWLMYDALQKQFKAIDAKLQRYKNELDEPVDAEVDEDVYEEETDE